MKKRILSVLMLLVAGFCLSACSSVASPDDLIVQEINFAKSILMEGTKERVLERVTGAKENDEEVVVYGTLAGVDGYYNLCLDNETEEINWIIFRYNSEFDAKEAAKTINSYLGKYDEYDAEFDSYTWDNEEVGLNIQLYAEEGTWIYPKFEYKEVLAERCSANGHQNTEWSEWDADYDEAVKVRENLCLDCEQIIDSESIEVTTFVENNLFTIHAAGFADRFDEQSARLNNIEYHSEYEYNENKSFYAEDNTVFYRIQDKNNNYSDVGMYSFNDAEGKQVARMNNYSQNIISCINILVEDSYDVSAVVYSAVLAIDPGIGYSEAADVGQKIVDSIAIAVGDIDESDFCGVDYNGINYLLYRDRDYHYLIIKPIEQ